MSFSRPLDCEFCAHDGKTIWGAEPDENWVVAAGCLKELHTRVWVVCSQHLAVFKKAEGTLPCPDCIPYPGHEISYLNEIRWERMNEEKP